MANWVVEARYPAAGGTWYTVSPVADVRFRKEVNTKWSGGFTVYTPVPPPGGLAVHYDMERLADTGKMKNLQGNATYDGAITGTSDAAGKYGRARSFNGASKVVAGSPASVLTGLTLAAWVSLSTSAPTDSFPMAAAKERDPGTGRVGPAITFGKAANALIVEVYKAGTQAVVTVKATPVVGTFYHVAVTYDGTTVRGYLDGAEVGTSTAISGSLDTTGTDVVVGERSTGTGNSWEGTVDEVYFYSEALTAQEVADLRDASLWDLMQSDNEVRVRETVAAKEWYRGRIRSVVADESDSLVRVELLDASVLLEDAQWHGRRVFPSVEAGVTMNEALSSPEREPKNGQVLYWDMETLAAGAVADLSGNGNAGVITGATGATGKWGTAYHHAVAGDKVEAVDSASLSITGDWSVAAFVRPDEIGIAGYFGIVDKYADASSSGYQVELALADAGTNANVTRGNGSGGTTNILALGTSGFADATWVHIAVTYASSNGSVSVYVNGTLRNTGTGGTGMADNAQALRTGGQFGGSPFEPCALDEVCVYNRVLSAAEVKIIAGVAVLAGGVGTVGSFTAVGFRAESESRLQLVDALARAVGGEWYVDRDGSDRDRVNLVQRIGSASPTDSFRLGQTAVLRDRRNDVGAVVNDWTAVGNNGRRRLESRNYRATTARTTLTADLTAAATSMTVADASAFPSTGVLYVGMERAAYTGKTGTSFTGLTRAYAADGYPSYAAYAHSSGIEVWLHADSGATPDVYYTPFSAQAGSSIRAWGARADAYTDQFYGDQNALDRLAQRLSERYQSPRESVLLDVYEDAVACDIGDAVTVLDENGRAYFASPYRVVAIEHERNDGLWRLELANYRDTFDRRMAEVRDDAADAMYYAAAAAASGVASASGSNTTLTTTTETAVATVTAAGVRTGERVAIRAWAQLTTGTGTTAVTPRIRRGSGTSGALVGEANAETLKAAAGGTEPFSMLTAETAYQDDPAYTLTLQQAGASGNGTSLQSHIEAVPVG